MSQETEPQQTPVADAPQTAGAEAGASADAPSQNATAPNDDVRRERDDLYDRLLRKSAEFDNYRKRIERERRDFVQQATADVLEELLPIVDNFERALQAEAGPQADGYRKGIELIYKQLTDLLAKRGVRPVEAVGQPFDPNFHQAITYETSPGHAEGEVIEEVRRGYIVGERLLRPAMVKVAKA